MTVSMAKDRAKSHNFARMVLENILSMSSWLSLAKAMRFVALRLNPKSTISMRYWQTAREKLMYPNFSAPSVTIR